MSFKRGPGQKPNEDYETYIKRIEEKVEQKLKDEYSSVPQRFSDLSTKSTKKDEHPIFRTTTNEFGKMDISEYERPTVYKTAPRNFTEKQHLGINFEHGGLNL